MILRGESEASVMTNAGSEEDPAISMIWMVSNAPEQTAWQLRSYFRWSHNSRFRGAISSKNLPDFGWFTYSILGGWLLLLTTPLDRWRSR